MIIINPIATRGHRRRCAPAWHRPKLPLSRPAHLQTSAAAGASYKPQRAAAAATCAPRRRTTDETDETEKTEPERAASRTGGSRGRASCRSHGSTPNHAPSSSGCAATVKLTSSCPPVVHSTAPRRARRPCRAARPGRQSPDERADASGPFCRLVGEARLCVGQTDLTRPRASRGRAGCARAARAPVTATATVTATVTVTVTVTVTGRTAGGGRAGRSRTVVADHLGSLGESRAHAHRPHLRQRPSPTDSVQAFR